jgi:hypothetical protein
MVPCAEMVALATLFDDGDAHGWSRAAYGEALGHCYTRQSAPPTSCLLPWHNNGWQGRLLRRLERKYLDQAQLLLVRAKL